MTYKVRLQPLAENDLAEAYLWTAKRAPETAGFGLTRFKAAINSLAEYPQRCGFAPEHRKLKRELRQLLFRRKPNVLSSRFCG